MKGSKNNKKDEGSSHIKSEPYEPDDSFGKIMKGVLWAVVGVFIAGFSAFFLLLGAAWGRPLRIKGKQVHAKLTKGNQWTRGEMPDATKLDAATRDALEALWLHDAQKEHASVPAFSRISWLLVSVGAPADLVEWSHRAAIEEIEHTQLCFALAQGYSNSNCSYTVKPMPELLSGGLDLKEDALIVLAKESLSDGCQLEDFNADVAAACAEVCEERVTRNVLKQIALEERSHAEFSWKLLEWTLEQSPHQVRKAIEQTVINLEKYKRPTAYSWDKKRLIQKADAELLLKHGRLDDKQWGDIWDQRLLKTNQRLSQLLDLEVVNKQA